MVDAPYLAAIVKVIEHNVVILSHFSQAHDPSLATWKSNEI